MYDYSPLSKLYIRNFRNLGDVEISFKESPIVTLVGENEAGKTSVIKAFATCALHANPRDQKDCIRDGTKMFGVAIELEDGTRVTRIKELTGINSYQISDANKNVVWSTNKLAEGLPLEVQKIMGLIAEPETGEFLHVRTYEDKLLFVVTPNSTNYKVMYNALKVEQLTKAIKNGSNEANTLKNAINTNELSIQTLGIQLRGIKVVDTEPLINVRNRLKSQLDLINKIESVKKLIDLSDKCEEQLGALALLDRFNLQPVSEVLANKLNNASRLLNKNNNSSILLYKLNDIYNISEIDTSILNRLNILYNKINELNVKINDAGALVSVINLSEISESVAIHVNRLSTLINTVKTDTYKLSKIDITDCEEIKQSSIDAINKLSKVPYMIDKVKNNSEELQRTNQYITQVQDYLKQCGVAVEACPNCGEAVIFDIDKMQ